MLRAVGEVSGAGKRRRAPRRPSSLLVVFPLLRQTCWLSLPLCRSTAQLLLRPDEDDVEPEEPVEEEPLVPMLVDDLPVSDSLPL